MYCRKCGNELKEDDIFCNKCGTKVEDIKRKETIVENSYTKNENVRNNNSIIRFIGLVVIISVIVIAVMMMLNKKGNYEESDIANQKSSGTNSNYSTELSSSEARRILEATIGYLKTNSYVITGNILNDGTYKYIESRGDKYIYAMTIKYNPIVNGHADTTKISSRTVYTFYNSTTDKFSVHYSLNSAQEEMNK